MGFTRITISLPEGTRETLKKIARKEMRSESNMIAFLIESYQQK